MENKPLEKNHLNYLHIIVHIPTNKTNKQEGNTNLPFI